MAISLPWPRVGTAGSAAGYEGLHAGQYAPEHRLWLRFSGHARTCSRARQRRFSSGWPGLNPARAGPSWAFSNHDAPRVASRWLPGRRARPAGQADRAMAPDLSARKYLHLPGGRAWPDTGQSFPYEKLQDPEAFTNWPHTLGRDGARTPMPWKHNGSNLRGSLRCRAVAAHREGRTWNCWRSPLRRISATGLRSRSSTRRLIALRKELSSTARTANSNFSQAPENVLAFTRRTSEGQKDVYCVFNLSGSSSG